MLTKSLELVYTCIDTHRTSLGSHEYSDIQAAHLHCMSVSSTVRILKHIRHMYAINLFSGSLKCMHSYLD
jgi:hypothetical protein